MIDLDAPEIVSAYDELPLWSAMFGLLLLDEVPLSGVRDALDVGCGTGFPLIELAERLGPSSSVHGIDPWGAGLARAREKIAARRTPNAIVHEASAVSMPFDASSFDLIVSNLGINNFDDRNAALRECKRVARPGAVIALTTNLQGHMREFYDAFSDVLSDDASRARLREHVEHRATVDSVRQLLTSNGFNVRRVVERVGTMRFANGDALFEHHFIKLGLLDAWKAVDEDALGAVRQRLRGEIRLTIPMAYIEATS